VRIVRIKNTLELDEIYLSEALVKEVAGRDDLEIIDDLQPMAFDKDGNLVA